MEDRCVCCGEIIPEGTQVCTKCLGKSNEPNCEKCRYRHWLIKYGAPSACGKDCDQYGTNLCEKMNDPDFIKWLEERGGKDGCPT